MLQKLSDPFPDHRACLLVGQLRVVLLNAMDLERQDAASAALYKAVSNSVEDVLVAFEEWASDKASRPLKRDVVRRLGAVNAALNQAIVKGENRALYAASLSAMCEALQEIDVLLCDPVEAPGVADSLDLAAFVNTAAADAAASLQKHDIPNSGLGGFLRLLQDADAVKAVPINEASQRVERLEAGVMGAYERACQLRGDAAGCRQEMAELEAKTKKALADIASRLEAIRENGSHGISKE